MIWHSFIDVSLRRFEATLGSDGLGEVDPGRSSISARPDEEGEPSYEVRLKFAGGVLEFVCRDMHCRIVAASEVRV